MSDFTPEELSMFVLPEEELDVVTLLIRQWSNAINTDMPHLTFRAVIAATTYFAADIYCRAYQHHGYNEVGQENVNTMFAILLSTLIENGTLKSLVDKIHASAEVDKMLQQILEGTSFDNTEGGNSNE